MKTTEEVYNILKDEFKEGIVEFLNEEPVDEIITVAPEKTEDIGFFLRDNEDLLFDSLMVLSGVDDANGKKEKQEDGSTKTVGATLSVYYHLFSYKLKHKVVIKTSVDKDAPKVKSVSKVWKCANWHEREAYDLIGVEFIDHPDPRRILMPYDWEGHPLQKDYKNPEFYLGMKVEY